jgi:hypothetical protein
VSSAASGNSGPAAPPAIDPRTGVALRIVLSALLVAGYYWARQLWAEGISPAIGGVLDPSTQRVLAVLLLLGLLVFVWRKFVLKDPRFHAPLLITTILAVSDAAVNFLENHPAPPWLQELTGGAVAHYSPTFLAILAAVVAEVCIGRFFWGKWPHLASAYISGISTGILIKSPVLWPFVACSVISITSKYVLRIGNRHLWNPTNFGVTMMLFLTRDVAPLSFQAGNNGLAVAVIWLMGGMILYRIGLFHITLAFVAAFVPLAFLRSYVTGHPWQTELAPVTSPMFQLFIFFMITDPKTITQTRRSQILVAVLVAVMETFLRLQFKDVNSLFHALFIVGPAANLLEIYFDRKKAKDVAGAAAATPGPPVEANGANHQQTADYSDSADQFKRAR